MSIELKEIKPSSSKASYHCLYINGKPLKYKFDYYTKNEISTGNCFREDSLLKKVQEYPCMEYPDKLGIICFLKKPLLIGLIDCIGIRRNGNTFSIGYSIAFKGEIYNKMICL